MATRAKTAPATEAIPAFPTSVVVNEILSLMTVTRGGVAKEETKQQKKENQERWKARMCGLAKEKSQNSVALWSESTGILNWDTSGCCTTSREETIFWHQLDSSRKIDDKDLYYLLSSWGVWVLFFWVQLFCLRSL